jgi:hypothetical protein
VSGHSLKLHVCMFEKSQGKHNSLDCHFFGEYFSLTAKFTCSKLNTKQKCFYMFKSLKPQKWIFFFPNVFFFYQMCTIFFENWKGF